MLEKIIDNSRQGKEEIQSKADALQCLSGCPVERELPLFSVAAKLSMGRWWVDGLGGRRSAFQLIRKMLL